MRIPTPKKFIIYFWLTILLTPLLAIVSCVIVDPFSQFNWVTISKINDQKPILLTEARLAKANHIISRNPSNIIFGNSRSEVGMDPVGPVLSNLSGESYNFSIAGCGIWEISQNLKHAYYASNNLQLAIINLDFMMFNSYREKHIFGTEVFGFDKKRLLTSPPRYSRWLNLLHDKHKYFGFDGISASLKTIIASISHTPTKSSYSYDYHGVLHLPRHIGQTDQVNDFGQAKHYIPKVWFPAPYNNYSTNPIEPGFRNPMDDFKEILRFCREKDIKLVLTINPCHAKMLIAIRATGFWSTYENWKRDLTQEIQLNNEANQGHPPFHLWDFSGFNSITTLLDEDEYRKWYQEDSHYYPNLGDIMISTALYGNTPIEDFGFKLTASNIEGHLERTNQLASNFEKDPIIKKFLHNLEPTITALINTKKQTF